MGKLFTKRHQLKKHRCDLVFCRFALILFFFFIHSFFTIPIFSKSSSRVRPCVGFWGCNSDQNSDLPELSARVRRCVGVGLPSAASAMEKAPGAQKESKWEAGRDPGGMEWPAQAEASYPSSRDTGSPGGVAGTGPLPRA